MSFRDLRREREERQRYTKSFISTNAEPKSEHPSPTTIDASSPVTLERNSEYGKAVRFDGLYDDMGPYIEIRTTKTRRRGLYIRHALRKGRYLKLLLIQLTIPDQQVR
jgi:hypothetical protein